MGGEYGIFICGFILFWYVLVWLEVKLSFELLLVGILIGYSWLGRLWIYVGEFGWLLFNFKVDFLEKKLENDVYRVWVVGFMLFVKLVFVNKILGWWWLLLCFGIKSWWKLFIGLIFFLNLSWEFLGLELYWFRLLKWLF